MKLHVETRDVLAGAYLPRRRQHTYLTHAVLVDDVGAVVEVLCRRVALDSLADRNAGDPHAKPTCAACARKLARFQGVPETPETRKP